MNSFTCDQCEEDFDLDVDMMNECDNCGGQYCDNCMNNHEMCEGE